MKREKKQPTRVANKYNFKLTKVEPLTSNQGLMLNSKKHLVAKGFAGTGKTFLALYLALKDIMIEDKYVRLVILRSAVPTRQLGHMPGTMKEKIEVYEEPYQDACTKLFGRADAYSQLKTKGTIEFMSTSFIRGGTLDNCVVIADECQNMNMHELDTIITRMGDNSRLIFSGDTKQDGDLGREPSGLEQFSTILRKMNEFDFIEFTIDDVVRSGLVKSYLTARYR
jgi:phosphate starvation-inducible protein PhoH